MNEEMGTEGLNNLVRITEFKTPPANRAMIHKMMKA